MRLYIIRHADPDYANDNITPAGRLEAAALARRMQTIKPDLIYCSPMGRAMATMRYTADALGMNWTIEEWTRELSQCRVNLPPWGDLTCWDVPGQVIRASKPYPTGDDWNRRRPFDNPLFAETFSWLQANSDMFFARHGYVREGGRYRIVEPNRLKIAMFCHGGFGLWWLAHLLEIPLPLMWSGFWLPPTSVTTVLFDERSREWAVPRSIGTSDVSHLYEAGLPVSRSGIKANFE